MSSRKWIFLITLICLIVHAAAAFGIESTPASMVANGTATATVTVSGVSGGQAVTFTVHPDYGSFSPKTATANAEGTAVSTFKAGTKSGSVTIYAEAGGVNASAVLTLLSGDPSKISYIAYDSEVTVNETTPITVGISDRYGNPVSGGSISFSVGSPTGDAGFWNGSSYASEIVLPVNATGYATAELRVDRIAGENIVLIQPDPPVRERYLTVYGIANATPAEIISAVEPAVCHQPADGESIFTITYTLFDRFGNPSGGHNFTVATDIAGEEPRNFTTNSLGQAVITYGPKDSVGWVTITATAVDNETVTRSDEVEFYHTAPVDMLLSASPQTMPSQEIDGSLRSSVRAKVIDVKGNPVEGEEVSFRIENVHISSGTQDLPSNMTKGNVTVLPGSTVTAATNEYGYAIVEFQPGSFTEEGIAATAGCDLVATWEDVTRTIHLSWMNFPYLSVRTEVDRERVSTGESVNVTVTLVGDGYMLQPDPIDVILCTDRSGSMLYDNPDRMHSAREAAKILVGQLSENRDQVGTISFGRSGYISRPGVNSGISTSEIDNDYIYPLSYSDYATIDSTLISNFVQVNQSLDEMVPDHGTPMRYGIYRSINELKENGRSSAVKAIVLLGDGDWNWYGDPLARGTGYPNANYPNVLPTQFGDLTQNYMIFSGLSDAEQNMAVYAENNGIRIYSIAYANSISYQGRSVLQKLAEETGGKYYYAPFGDDLAGIYAEIAGDLKTEAGVGTEVHLCFNDITVNNKTISNGSDVFDYVHREDQPYGNSTWIQSYDRNTGEYYITPDTRDDTASWNANQTIHFDVGTIVLDQVWETNVRLKVKRGGNINIFGPGSKITFDGGEELTLPDTFITAVLDLNETG
ncbi:MAG: VWA domain-containing protein, partial [Methanomicrobiaceae archaeon]|nr:VWA domain-containing protein [Methanomicrobiaceae archaeon]